MNAPISRVEHDEVPVLSEDVPVTMPALPAYKIISEPEQFKAFGDPLRVRILGVIQQQPATAKQIADALGVPPGTIGHHLQVLEAAGLAQVVARRLVRGIVAKYYTRTGRIFSFDYPNPEHPEESFAETSLAQAEDELRETLAATPGKEAVLASAYPRLRLSPERAERLRKRLNALTDELLEEGPDEEGQVYALIYALFVAPPFLQGAATDPVGDDSAGESDDADHRA